MDYYLDTDDELDEDFGPLQDPTDNTYRITLPVLLFPDEDMSWRSKSMCVVYPSVSWFGGTRANQIKAKTICNEECEVRAECLEFALRNNEQFGIWGGMYEEERKVLVRSRNVAS